MSQPVSRRDAALAAIASTGAAVLRGQTDSAPGIGAIGLGNRFRAHLAALSQMPEARLTALSDLDSKKIDAVNAGLPSPAASYTDYRELLRDKNVGAVVIATPNFSHHDIAIAALRAGKDVLLEKPIAITYKEAREIQEEARRNGRILAIGMQRIFRSDIELVETIRRGEIGTPRLITSGEFRRDWFPGGWIYRDPATGKSANWRFMKGAIGSSELEFSIHLYATLCRIIGSPLKTLSATGGALHYRDRQIRDASSTIVEFASGLRLSHTYCMFAPQSPFVVVLGENGSLRREGGRLSLFDREGKPRPLPPVERPDGSDEVLMYRDFFECVRTRRQPQAGAGLAIEAAKIAYGQEISIAEGRVVTAGDFPA
ncbi:MAG TPA: Gfo/Idh/MocA family oxidoreductase [Bryobacteraceae bacterium]|nr:Gfo/Idh/MocA family oxidoreductase [Bryobacteraceae bacterium]